MHQRPSLLSFEAAYSFAVNWVGGRSLSWMQTSAVCSVGAILPPFAYAGLDAAGAGWGSRTRTESLFLYVSREGTFTEMKMVRPSKRPFTGADMRPS